MSSDTTQQSKERPVAIILTDFPDVHAYNLTNAVPSPRYISGWSFEFQMILWPRLVPYHHDGKNVSPFLNCVIYKGFFSPVFRCKSLASALPSQLTLSLCILMAFPIVISSSRLLYSLVYLNNKHAETISWSRPQFRVDVAELQSNPWWCGEILLRCVGQNHISMLPSSYYYLREL